MAGDYQPYRHEATLSTGQMHRSQRWRPDGAGAIGKQTATHVVHPFFLILLAAVGLGSLVMLVKTAMNFRKLSWKAWLGRLALAPMPVLAVVMLGYFWFRPYEPASPGALAHAYEIEFKSFPPPDVTDIRSRVVSVGDAWEAWLTFKASPTTVDLLLQKFTPSDQGHFEWETIGGNPPPWWQPGHDGMVAYYSASGWRKDFGGSRAVIAHDASKRTVYFHHGASD